MSRNAAANLATLLLVGGIVLIVVSIVNIMGWWGVALVLGIIIVAAGLGGLSYATRDDARPR